ncbi:MULTISPECIES: hypothetical protein [Chryseobacterium]|uniref:Uncharacterized protein n=1 Tax=Chryseobacterium geocarposphaerae TaxID=1416776 RepID=A0ABU1L8S5_9FLAO|nr:MULTISPECIES: hypothetical protein [Chryseobacterium]MDR6403114.1 hypothetical protein [Chryseobacterium geocarposphaerae]MDR6696669.1 hypothetical protein [Chryseobacterium ginsenosidimutans]
MKKIVLSIVIIISVFLYQLKAQIGINTSNPQGSFNIDAAKDNPATGTPSAAQQANDINVTPAGNVGLGTVAPAVKLDIVGTTFGMKNSTGSGSWDNIWFNVTPSIPSINVSGAEAGLQFNVGANSVGTYGDGQTLTTVATMLSNGNVGVGVTAPTNTLDVNGTARVRSITPVAGTNVVTPVYSDANGVLVKASPSAIYGGTTSNTVSVASGATAPLITGIIQGVYKAMVIDSDACVYVATAEYFVNNFSFNGSFAIRGVSGLLSPSATKGPTFTETNQTTTVTTWTGKPTCQDGGNSTALNYTLTMPSAGTINVTNNGNVTRSYKIILTRID